jgi:hypothetical protein
MTTKDFITDLFCRVDDRMKNVPILRLERTDCVNDSAGHGVPSAFLIRQLDKMGGRPGTGAEGACRLVRIQQRYVKFQVVFNC